MGLPMEVLTGVLTKYSCGVMVKSTHSVVMLCVYRVCQFVRDLFLLNLNVHVCK